MICCHQIMSSPNKTSQSHFLIFNNNHDENNINYQKLQDVEAQNLRPTLLSLIQFPFM